jgi:hypothetical protein
LKRTEQQRTWAWITGTLVVGTALAGCGESAPDPEGFLPSADVARRALELALNTWQSGGQPNRIQADSLTVQPVDLNWKSGKQLAAFTILQEETHQKPPRFTVRLTWKDNTEEVVHYVVVGRDPIWLFRQQEFERVARMDHEHSSTPPGAQSR